jgi:acyl-CoA thioesterase I
VILGRLRAETKAKLAVLTIPPLGENLNSRMNGLVDGYNDTLREVAARHEVDCLPLHDRLVEALDATRTPPPYTGNIRKVMTAGARHLIFRQSWNTVSRRNGLSLLTDHIHLNDRAAAVVADLISTFLRESLS